MTSASIPTTPTSPASQPRVRRRDASEQVSDAPVGRWAASPTLTARELCSAALAGLVLAIITTWPLVAHMPSRIAPDLGDPVRTAWQVAWVGYGMLHHPLHLFDANVFYPRPLSLAFSDSLLGYGPAAFFGSGTVAALVRYNLLFLFAWSLCFLGAYLLGRELGAGRFGAVVAGAAFAYAPYRVTEAGHLHVISSGGIPLALFLLLRGYRRGSRRLVIAGWLASAWQISLGFTLGLQYSYLLAALTLIAVWHWWRLGRPGLPRRMIAVTCIGIAVLGAITIYEARPYLKISHDYPTARRTIREVKTYSAGPAAFLSASTENRVWGSATSTFRKHVHSKNESVLFPGLAIFVLAILGLCAPLYTRRLRIGLLVGVVVCSVLALGLGLTGAGYPYRLLYDYAPGWDGVRVPGRVFTMSTLFLALLAAAGASWLLGWVRARSAGAAPRVRDGLPALVCCLLVIGVVGEGAGHLGHPLVPQPAAAEVSLNGPILDLPTDGASDRVWQYFSTNGFPKIAQGNSTFDIPSLDDLRGGVNGFPDRASIEKLRYYGIRTVVLHTRLPKLPGLHGYSISEPPDVNAAAAKPIAGLGVKRTRFDGGVIYRIGPGPKALHGSD
jgi:hypothetical protein